MVARPEDAEAIEWDETNEAHLAAHGIGAHDVWQVCSGAVAWVPNKRHRSGDWKVVGYNSGGRALTVIMRYYPDRRVLRPITGWPCTDSERTKYLS